MITIFGLSACKKDSLSKFEIEKSFSDPAIRFEDFKKALADGTDGFKVIIEPTTSTGIIGGYIKFNTGDNATILLDNSLQNATTPFVNKYSLKISQTNSVLSLGKSTPFAVISNAIGGVDTTYTYQYSSGDTLKLVGDALGTKMSLLKMTKEDGDGYMAGKMAEVITNIDNIMHFPTYFKRITSGGKSYDVTFNTISRTAIFNYAEGSAHKMFSTAYAYSNSGLDFKKPLVDGATTISSLTNLVVNLTGHSATLSMGGATGTLTNELVPAAMDQTAANTFLTSPFKDGWSESYTGFTISGTEDALGITSIPSFYSIDFYPGSDEEYSTVQFWLTSAYYSLIPAGVAYATEDGKLQYEFLGYLGSSTVASTSNIVARTASIFAQTEGFYVISTMSSSGAPAYDLVNVRNATSWITFE